MSLTLLLCILVVFCVWFKKRYENKRVMEFAKKLRGPKSWPIIGDVLIFAVPRNDILKAFNNVYEKYESPNRYWIGSELHVGIDKPEHFEAVLTSPIAAEKGNVYEIIAESIGRGLIQRNGPSHRFFRKLMIMPLRQKVLEKYIHVFNEKAIECAKSMEVNLDGDLFDVKEPLQNCIMALICEMILGAKINYNNENNIKLVEALDRLFQSIAERIYKVWLHPTFLHKFSNNYKEQINDLQFTREFLTTLIDKRKTILKDVNEENFKYDDNTSLDLLLLAKNEKNQKIFSEADLMDQVMTLITASEDTTVTVTSFTILMLAIHKDIQEKVWKEQISVLGSDIDPSKFLQTHHLKEMTYLGMVIQEVLRLYPIAPNLVRKLKDDFQMGEYFIPKDVNIVLNTFYAHRNENIWPKPDKFDPLRFTPEEKAKRHPFAYIPFSGGVRGCIGKEFAFIAIKCIVSNIIRNYTLDTDWTMDNVELEGDISIRSTNGYKIKIKKREIR